jgi:hypothetical protein
MLRHWLEPLPLTRIILVTGAGDADAVRRVLVRRRGQRATKNTAGAASPFG